MKIDDLKVKKGIQPNKQDALLIVDMQYDFIPGGSLPVEGGDLIVDDINKVAKRFKKSSAVIVLTQDWHPRNHLSFASNHDGKNPGDEYSSEDGAIGPVLWPDHCVQGTKGAEFLEKLNVELANAIIRKGMNPKVDSYSGFLENDKESETGLNGYLESLNIERVFICGLALDYCCYSTAIDAANFGFETHFFVDLTKGIDLPPGNLSNALENMKEEGIIFVNKDSFE